MNSMDIAKNLILNELNIAYESLKDRLLLHKKVYLLQEIGVDMGYRYYWNVHGVYSPDLINYVYSNTGTLNSCKLKYMKLQTDVLSKIMAVNNFSNKMPNGIECVEVDWYIVTSSILYIHRNAKLWGIENTKEAIKQIVFKEFPAYRDRCSIFDHGYSLLIEEHLI